MKRVFYIYVVHVDNAITLGKILIHKTRLLNPHREQKSLHQILYKLKNHDPHVQWNSIFYTYSKWVIFRVEKKITFPQLNMIHVCFIEILYLSKESSYVINFRKKIYSMKKIEIQDFVLNRITKKKEKSNQVLPISLVHNLIIYYIWL